MGEGIDLERLNLRTPKIFDYTDEAETINRRIHFYCISEGATEESYFYGVRNNKTELNIKNDVYIEVIEKQEGQETLSHPMQLVKACLFQMGRIDLEGNSISKDKWAENCKWDNFELWLLMHFPNIKQYAPEMLLENRKNLRHQLFPDASSNKKYLEILVSKNADGYAKGRKLKFERFLQIGRAHV